MGSIKASPVPMSPHREMPGDGWLARVLLGRAQPRCARFCTGVFSNVVKSLSSRSRSWTLVVLLSCCALSAVCWAAVRLGENVLGVFVAECPPLLWGALALIAGVAALLRFTWRAFALAAITLDLAVGSLGGLQLHFGSSGQPPEYRVLSLNIEQWNTGGAAIGRAIAAADPDVFCLQEAGNYDDPSLDAEFAALHAALPAHAIVRQGEIVIGSKLPIASQSFVTFAEGPQSRPLLELVLTPPDGEPISVFSAHLLYTGYISRTPAGLLHADRARRAQAQAIVERARELDHPSLLCGDLNAAPNSAPVARLRQHFRDAWREQGTGFGATISSRFPLRRIDYVLVHGLDTVSIEVLGAKVSDHLAVLANVRRSK